ncbi:MAG: MFS transporter [Hyphomicrobiaceae bacterium]
MSGAPSAQAPSQVLEGGARKRVLGATCGAHAVHDGIADALYVLLPIWASSFGLSYAAAGSLKSAYSIALAALQMPAGMLAERLGERLLLGVGTVAAGAAFALAAWAPGYAALFALILATGVASAVQHPIGSSLIAKAYDGGGRRSALGVYNFAGDVGKMAAAVLIGAGAAWYGWRAITLGYGIAVAAVGIAVLIVLGPARRSALAGPRSVAPPDPKDAAGGRQPGFGFTDARGYAILSAIQVVDSAGRVGVLTLVPFLLVAKGASTATAGLALTLLFAGGAAGKLACGLLAERLGLLATVMLTEVMTAVLIVAVILSPLPLALACLPVLGIALNGTSSVLYGTVSEFVRADRQARAFGLFYSLGSAAGATAPVLFGLVSDRAGLATALYAVATVVLATLPLALALRPHLARASRGM